ncbi:MAG: anti-sigma factor antagonist [Chloroflexia bacterium]|nr:anti-sigma factor antagonist [Chloroflexia bacterium]
MSMPEREHLLERVFPGQLNQLTPISEFVMEAGRQVGLDENALFSIQMAVDEAATNIIVHGYEENGLEGTIHLFCWQQGRDFVVQLRDSSPPFNPDCVPEPNLDAALAERREGGLGIFLMRRMMDRVEFAHEDGQNVLTMTRCIGFRADLPDGSAEVSPRGRIDATRSRELERLLRDPLEAGARLLLLNLSQVGYISSSALRVLLIVAKDLKRQQGTLLFCCPRDSVARVLHITGFDRVFSVYETREAAVQALEACCAPGT